MKKHRSIYRLRVFWLFFLMICAAGMPLAAESNHSTMSSKTLKALIVTGQSSHDWQTSSQILKQIMEDTGLFEVELAVSPEEGTDMDGYNPQFSDFDVVVLNSSGDLWPNRTQKSFVNYVESGGGLVVYHSAGRAFPDWDVYSEIIGLGGGQRDEDVGPYVYWNEGGIVEEMSPGISGYHGEAHDFEVVNRTSEHPITAGLPLRWMHAGDELYSLLRGRTQNLTILATAYSDVQHRGTNRHEPVLFTNRYGAGRIFHTTLGHVSGEAPFPAAECAGFIVTFQRGAEWAATGKVTQAVPGDFPGLDRDIPTPSDVRRWHGYRPPALGPILEELSRYEYGKDESILSRLREYIQAHTQNSQSRKQSEHQLLLFLESDATLAGKMAACRHLRYIGTESSVSVLEKMLFHEDTSDMARYALENIPGSEAENALIRGLLQNTPKNRVGIITSLGQREVESAIPELETLLKNSDRAVVAATVKALGWIGGEDAAAVLSSVLLTEKGESRVQAATSLLKCAEKFHRANQLQKAADLYKQLMSVSLSAPVRQAALKGLLLSDKEGAKSLLLDVLKGKQTELFVTAVSQIPAVLDDSGIKDVLMLMPALPVRTQQALFPVLTSYASPEVLSAVKEATENEDAGIRIAALTALKTLGDSSCVPLLAERGAHTQGREQQAAQNSLWNLKSPGVDQTILLELVRGTDPSIQRELIRSVGERRILDGKHIQFDLVLSSDPQIRQDAIRYLEPIIEASDLPRLLELLLVVDLDSEKEALKKVVASAAAQIPERNRRATPVIDKLSTLENELERSDLLRILGVIGDNRTLPLLREALENPRSPGYDSAARALMEWPDFTPRDDLLGIAQTSDDLSLRVLSLRTYIEMVGSERARSPFAAVQSLKQALDTAERREEKVQILALLPQFPCDAALALAESLSTDDSVKEEAALAIKKIREKLENTEQNLIQSFFEMIGG